MDSCCRVCSRSDEFRRFSLYAVAEVSQEVIANMIRDTSDTQISSEDGLPQQICPECLMTLSLAYSFRKQCRRSDAKFREYWGGRTPQSIEQQQQQQLPRLSQSQAPDDSSFEAVTTIKEEVDIYDYEYSVPSLDNEWVIQNPRTIGEGAMTVVHNSGQYYDEASALANDGSACDRDVLNSMPIMVIQPEDHDPAEIGESSGLAQKGEKWKKKPPTPERYSQRIRRQEDITAGSYSAPQMSEPEWSRFSVNVFQERPTASSAVKTIPSQGQLRCEHCKKKMKKPYKHRNGKCLVSKSKSSSRPKCAYCHQTFVSSKGIPGHLRNSCRIYRQVCEAKGIGLPVFNPQTDQSSSPAATPSESVTNETPESKHSSPVQNINVEQKPKIKRTRPYKWNPRLSCQYCSRKFKKRSNLIRHQQQCETSMRTHEENISAITYPADDIVNSSFPLRDSQDDKSAIVKDQHSLDKLPEVETTCIYCQQNMNKKTRFLHHNGRCVLGRVNAEFPCPYCPEAFSTRNLLQKHRCQPLREEQNNLDAIEPSDSQSQEQNPNTEGPTEPINEEETPLKRRDKIMDESPKSIVKREFCSYCRQRIKESDRQKHKEKRCFNNNETTYNCGYCRKCFASRESLIEHQRICTVRKQHKQVKCQFCGAMISNRGNLRKHQKVYCKSVKRENDGEEEKQIVVKEEKTVKKKKRVKKEAHEEDVENIPLKQRKTKSKINSGSEHKTKKKQASKKHRFPCENCTLTFDTEAGARKHFKKCSTKAPTDSFMCEYCSLAFVSKSNLYRHQRILCKKVDPDEEIVNQTIKEFSLTKTEETTTCNVKENEILENPSPDDDPLSVANLTRSSELCRTEPEQMNTSTDDDAEGNGGNYSIDVPEPKKEIIIPEIHLPPEDVGIDSREDPHVLADNNNADMEKESSETVVESTIPLANERNEDSFQSEDPKSSMAEEIVPDCEHERNPMQVEHSEN